MEWRVKKDLHVDAAEHRIVHTAVRYQERAQSSVLADPAGGTGEPSIRGLRDDGFRKKELGTQKELDADAEQ